MTPEEEEKEEEKELLEMAQLCPDCDLECDIMERTKLNDLPGVEHWIMECPECEKTFVIEFKDGKLN